MWCICFGLFFFLMIRRPPRSNRTDTLFPYTTLFRSGLALLFALMLAMLGNQGMETMLPTLAIVAALLVALKWLYWHGTDRAGLPGSRAAAIGLPEREATVFERPPTEANYRSEERRVGTELFSPCRTSWWRYY